MNRNQRQWTFVEPGPTQSCSPIQALSALRRCRRTLSRTGIGPSGHAWHDCGRPLAGRTVGVNPLVVLIGDDPHSWVNHRVAVNVLRAVGGSSAASRCPLGADRGHPHRRSMPSDEPGRERRWLCTETGRDTAEATREVIPSNSQMNEAVARSAAHLIGTNDVGISLARRGAPIWRRGYPGTRSRPPLRQDQRLDRRRRPHRVRLWRFIEYDRGTESSHILVEKLRAYVEVAGHRPPAQEGKSPPSTARLAAALSHPALTSCSSWAT